MKRILGVVITAATLVVVLSESEPRGRGEIIGENTPVPSVGELGGPDRVLSPPELTTWIEGRRLFDHDFHMDEGLGAPEYNGDSCRACHQFPTIGGHGGLDLNVSRFGDDGFGTQAFMNLPGGQAASKFRRVDLGGREEIPPNATVFEQRQTPPLFGLGHVDSIFETAILAGEDPTDADGDGIFGVARRVSVAGLTEVGRFGWKNQVPRLADFVRDAMGGECGITVTDNGRGFGLLTDDDGIPDPEITSQDLNKIAFFLQHLAPPARAGSTDPAVALGETLFNQVGCAKCHTPSLPGLEGDVPLYSDLLLHDVLGPGFRGMAEPGADVGMYGTPPLWGARLSAPYFHDGRAETIADAIAMHQGEAAGVIAAFNLLSASDRQALIDFVMDL